MDVLRMRRGMVAGIACVVVAWLLGNAPGAAAQDAVGEAVGLKDAQLAFWYRKLPGDWGPIDEVWAYNARADFRLPAPWNRLGIVWGVLSETGWARGTIRHAETGQSFSGKIRYESPGMFLGLKLNTPPAWWRRGYLYAMGGGVFKGVRWLRREVREYEVYTPVNYVKPDMGWKATGFGVWGEVGLMIRVWKRLQLGVGYRAQWLPMDIAGERRNAGGHGPVFLMVGYQHHL